MKVDRRLNLVLTVERDEGPAYVHSTPISTMVWERYFLTISKTYAAMTAQGGEWMMRLGPRTAKLMLKRVAEADGAWGGPEGVESGLLAEVRRLSNVVRPTPEGWETLPLQEAVDKHYFDEEDVGEVENAITFFIVCSASMKRSEAERFIPAVFGMLDAQCVSSAVTEYMQSLPTSRLAESTGERVRQSSTPR